MSLFSGLFGKKKNIQFDIALNEEEKRPQYRLELQNSQVLLFSIYGANEDIKGVLNIHVPKGSRLEHTGISIHLIGSTIDFTNDAAAFDFLKEEKSLETPGVIMGRKSFKFSFKHISKKYESLYGINVRVHYFLRVIATRTFVPNLIEEKAIWVIKKEKEPQGTQPIKMEVGVEDCLQIELNFEKNKFHIHDVIFGKIHFILARIKILHMDIEIIRKEIIGEGDHSVIESEKVAVFEVMDGQPVKDEVIPVRMYLKPYGLSPSFKNVNKLFSVKYFVNLVLIDAEDRRFFKQQEIFLWRDSDSVE